MLLSKIHRATVTQADLAYVGSLTLDADLMAASGLAESQQIDVLDVTNGNRLTTYLIAGQAGSGVVGINGAAAHLIMPGDTVIIAAYGLVAEQDVASHQPRVVFVDSANRITGLAARAGQAPAQQVL
ncbi:MAG: aspartate 1-decarboxylase [Bifidobacteriaceae bacterium]|jgi:aspartate 1-decarboxylase|nr:aspartate 1-decarboxylase [Bifidobacteriaceae bacterium]